MVKLKSIKKKIRNIKCCVQKVLTTKQPEKNNTDDNVYNQPFNQIRPNAISNTSSSNVLIPPAAKDSQWVGLEFRNPNLLHTLNAKKDKRQQSSVDPIFILFPGLKKSENPIIKGHETSSTSEVTRLLVGQKPDVRVMKDSNKLTPTDNKLPSVPEVPQDVDIASESDITFCLPQTISHTESGGKYEDDTDSEPSRATHTKRRKKKSDVRVIDAGTSSDSVLPILPQRPPSRTLKQSSTSCHKRFVFSSPHPSFADGEEEEAPCDMR